MFINTAYQVVGATGLASRSIALAAPTHQLRVSPKPGAVSRKYLED